MGSLFPELAAADDKYLYLYLYMYISNISIYVCVCVCVKYNIACIWPQVRSLFPELAAADDKYPPPPKEIAFITAEEVCAYSECIPRLKNRPLLEV